MQLDFVTEHLKLEQLAEMLTSGKPPLSLSASSHERILESRSYLDEVLSARDRAIYGINTGFGFLCDRQIAFEDQQQLQINLILSHSCGTGEEVPAELVRLMLLLKVKSLSLGYSGVRLETIERLLAFFNHDILPTVYTQGSLGASGDLAPLAHLSLPLIGEGTVRVKGTKMSSREMLQQKGWEPLQLAAKEGLALLNGTQFMLAYGIHLVLRAKHLFHWATYISAMSMDAFGCLLEPFHELIHFIRPHKGQVEVATLIRELLENSPLANQPKTQVQDPYSFRCIPQVHGASFDALGYVSGVLETELNSATDNPNIFPENDMILSGGNFHGQPLAISLDFLSIALAEMASISERRIYQLLSGVRGLPLFLVADPGLNSGFMIPQYVAAGLVSENKQLCTPASVDTIPSSNNQEDHVSMGANAATKCLRVLENLEKVLGIELMNAAQALAFRSPLTTSPALEPILSAFREQVPFAESDRLFHDDMQVARTFIHHYSPQDFH
ncbi:MAG: histidine ammonia-lyase [Bacteroidota bacterium]